MLPKFYTFFALASTALAAPSPNLSFTHKRVCGNIVSSEQIAASNKGFQEILASKGLSLESFSKKKGAKVATGEAAASSIVVNVYFHVVYASSTLTGGYVPDSQIADQIDVLNADYADSGITFQLVETTRTQSSSWFNRASSGNSLQTAMKKALRQGTEADLNVYTVGFNDGSGLLGYATFPEDYTSNPSDDGVVILYSSVPGGSAEPYNLGRTLTHEAGHWFGLYHVFDDYGTSCSDYDLVPDTPPQKEPSYGCPTGKDSCTGDDLLDSIQNYMDYSDDSCMTEFSAGQATRMAAQVATYRGLVGTPEEDPVEEDPVEEDPVEEDPVEEDPVEEDPVEEDPIEEDPVEEDPIEEDPVEEDP